MANYTILLIDYEPRSIERFRQPLTEAGYAVEVATDGITGIEAFHRLNPDMVLVEAMIPKKHGFEVCQELKRTPHGRKTPILITTGVYKGRKYRTQALHIYGCDEYIEKPIAPEQLLGVVGKFFGPGAATTSAAAAESRPAPPAQAAVIAASDGVTRASVPVSISHEQPPAPPLRPKSNSGSVVKDFTEEEIMARLDAILPGGDFAPAPVLAPQPDTMVTASEPISSPAPLEIPETHQAVYVHEISDEPAESSGDPFAQMQAELTAELGSISAALALEPAPIFESEPAPYPSDQALAPSVLEALPSPELEPTVTSIPLSPAETEPELPGQLVSFDAKRSRRNKKSNKKNQARAAEAQPPASAVPTSSAPAATASRATSATLSLPTGTLAESDLEGTPAKKGVPLWIWAAIAVAAMIAAYFVLLREPTPAPEVSGRIPVRAPVRRGETTAALQHIGAPATAPSSDSSAYVLNSVDSQALRPAPESAPNKNVPPPAPQSSKPAPGSVLPVAPAAAPPAPKTQAPSKKTEFVAPAPIGKTLATPKPKLVVPEAPLAPGQDEGVAGIETILEPAARVDAPTIAPGTLVDAAEVDTPPQSLSRKLPTYSMQARQMRLQGTVVMKVLVNERGTVDDVVLVEGVNGADLNNSAMRAAKSWTYRPATKGGVPVKVWKTEQIVFKI